MYGQIDPGLARLVTLFAVNRAAPNKREDAALHLANFFLSQLASPIAPFNLFLPCAF